MTIDVPSELISGDTWTITLSDADHPAGTWTSTLYFENADSTFNQAGSVSGTDHVFTIAAATTATKKAGRYRFSVRVSSAGVSATVGPPGWVDVLPDPAAAGTRDLRSWARRTLDELEQLLEQFATTAQQSGSINGRSWTRADLQQLRDWRAQLRSEVRTEESGNGGSGRDIKMRLSRG